MVYIMRMNKETVTKRRRGRVPGPKTDRYQVLLSPELAEWGKQQPGGLSELLRRLMQDAREQMQPSPETRAGTENGEPLSGDEPTAVLQRRFRRLAQKWKRSQTFTSSTTQIVLDPAYQEIIGMGYPAVPLILHELEKEPDHWFWALRSITGEEVIRPSQRGNLKQMTDAWLRWGRERGFIA
jgi:hypothetical protein